MEASRVRSCRRTPDPVPVVSQSRYRPRSSATDPGSQSWSGSVSGVQGAGARMGRGQSLVHVSLSSVAGGRLGEISSYCGIHMSRHRGQRAQRARMMILWAARAARRGPVRNRAGMQWMAAAAIRRLALEHRGALVRVQHLEQHRIGGGVAAHSWGTHREPGWFLCGLLQSICSNGTTCPRGKMLRRRAPSQGTFMGDPLRTRSFSFLAFFNPFWPSSVHCLEQSARA